MNRIMKILSALFFLAASQAPWAEVININTATAEQFETLNGIGTAKAQAIIDDRNKNGPFQSIDDLDRVNGIGSATIEKNRANLSVGPMAAASEKTDESALPATKSE